MSTLPRGCACIRRAAIQVLSASITRLPPGVAIEFCSNEQADLKRSAQRRVEHIVLDRLDQVLIEADIGGPPAIIGLPVNRTRQ